MYTYANIHTHTLNFVLVQPRFLNLIQYVFTLYQIQLQFSVSITSFFTLYGENLYFSKLANQEKLRNSQNNFESIRNE